MMAQSREISIQRQNGVALFTVLILLAILATASVALIQSQRGAVRQTADRLEVLDRAAASARTHDACVATLRAGLEGAATAVLTGLDGQDAWRSATDANWDSNGCIFEWYGLPEADTSAAWVPQVRVTSRAVSGNDVDLEVSEWRYPPCGTKQTEAQKICRAGGVIQVKDRPTAVSVKYSLGEIMTTRRPI